MKAHTYFDAHTHTADNPNSIGVQNIILSKNNTNFNLYDNQLYSVGIHPWYIDNNNTDKKFKLLETLSQKKNIVAIGECGLDKSISSDWNLQIDIFIRQIRLSENIKIPLIIHSLRSHSEILEIRKKTKAKQIWIIHGYNKNWTLAKEFISKNCILSLGNHILKNTRNNKELLEQLSLDSFLIESDEKKVNLRNYYTFIAKERNISINTLLKAQKDNFNKIFKR